MKKIFYVLRTVVLALFYLTACGTKSSNTAPTNPIVPDVTPPAIVSTTPTEGTENVGVDVTITAAFNKLMNPSTITNETFTIDGGVQVS